MLVCIIIERQIIKQVFSKSILSCSYMHTSYLAYSDEVALLIPKLAINKLLTGKYHICIYQGWIQDCAERREARRFLGYFV
jgi:hypothetical protein